MIVDKIVNNNVVTAILDNQEEAVVMGRGIGFKKKPGDTLEPNKIEKIFKLDNPKTQLKIKELLEDTKPEYFLVTEKIVKQSERILSIELDELIYVLLTDHIVFAVQRFHQGIELANPMAWEIKNLYKEEYNIGLWALDLIKEELDAELPIDEAAFIALHIVNASLGEEIYNTMNITILTKDILKIIKSSLKLEFNEDSLDYIRLVTHLKFFAQRIFKREQVVDEDEDLYDILSHKYLKEKKCVDKIAKYIKREFNYNLNNQEKVYLILHIRKVSSSNNK